MEKYDVAIFCGRFQPFHNGHYAALQQALKIADKVLILVGSSKSATNIKNPFSFKERKEMIESCLVTDLGGGMVKDLRSRVEIIPLRDHFYSDDLWLSEFQSKVSKFIEPNHSVALIGRYKDSSSYYLNLFPQWEFHDVGNTPSINATDIREMLFDRDPDHAVEVHRVNGYGEKVVDHVKVPSRYNEFYNKEWFWSLANQEWKKLIPEPVEKWLEKNYFYTYKYATNVMEFLQIKKYKASWESAPFPPTFVTADAVVLCAGHVLLVRRKFSPGQGQLALPGGFIRQNEKIVDAALRELREETGISTVKAELMNHVDESKVFDYPGRSLRGRTITHAYCVRLPYKELPTLKAGSDAEAVKWYPIADALAKEAEFFEDHYSILSSFLIR